jgi:hypothetical protein
MDSIPSHAPTPAPQVPISPIRVTLVNRYYEQGRSILNMETIRERIAALPVVQEMGGVEVEVVYLKGTLRCVWLWGEGGWGRGHVGPPHLSSLELDLLRGVVATAVPASLRVMLLCREQAEKIWKTSIFVWAHGAAMAHSFFLTRVRGQLGHACLCALWVSMHAYVHCGCPCMPMCTVGVHACLCALWVSMHATQSPCFCLWLHKKPATHHPTHPPTHPPTHQVQGSSAIEIIQWPIEDSSNQTVWVEGIRTAFDLDISLTSIINDDRTRNFFNLDVSVCGVVWCGVVLGQGRGGAGRGRG